MMLEHGLKRGDLALSQVDSFGRRVGVASEESNSAAFERLDLFMEAGERFSLGFEKPREGGRDVLGHRPNLYHD
jgi:hypothetical protein